MIEYPNILDKIFDKLNKHNAKPIIIGGYIRDFLLNIDSNDIDIEVYNISTFKKLENILKEFGNVTSVGKNFGVCKLSFDDLSLDFTLPRIDSKIGSGHSGFNVKIDENLDFTLAAKRRDFTINAIGYDVVNKKMLDPYNGIADLKKKALKMVNTDTFIEDPLRVLRAVQFCARFDLKMDRELFSLCFKMVEQNMLQELPKERIYEEIKKLLLKSPNPSLGFTILKELNALKYFLKCSCSMTHIDKMAKENITNKRTKEVLMLATMCYSFSPFEIEELILNFSNDKRLLKEVVLLVKNLNVMQNLYSKKSIDYELYKLATKLKVEELLVLSEIIFGKKKSIKIRVKELGILNKKMPALLHGRDLISLGMKPSAKFTIILDDAYEAQMHKKFNSHKEAIEWLKNY